MNSIHTHIVEIIPFCFFFVVDKFTNDGDSICKRIVFFYLKLFASSNKMVASYVDESFRTIDKKLQKWRQSGAQLLPTRGRSLRYIESKQTEAKAKTVQTQNFVRAEKDVDALNFLLPNAISYQFVFVKNRRKLCQIMDIHTGQAFQVAKSVNCRNVGNK